MSLKKVLVSGAAALALIGTAATAALVDKNNQGTDVRVACDGTGDYLIAPVYYAVGKCKTELKVVNTNTTRAIVAKVVIRESKECDEIMDFAIYLTPGDVWTGTLYQENGVVKLISTDDSMIIGGQPASPSNPIVIGIHPLREGAQNGMYHHENWHGYVEVFGMASYDPAKIVAAYNASHDPDVPGWKECAALDKKAFYTMVKSGNDIVNAYDAQDVGNSDLLGKAILVADEADINKKRYMALNMTALENFSLGPVFTGAIGGETKLENMSKRGNNVLPLYDAALAKEKVFVMYEGDGNSVYPIRTHFTVPTKKYWFDLGMMPSAYSQDDLYGEGSSFVANTPSEYYYSLNPNGNEIIARDMQENCNKCSKSTEVSGIPSESCEIKVHEEVHFFEYSNTNPANLYDSSNPYKDLLFANGGYVSFDLTNNTYTTSTDTQKGIDSAVSFKGMPVIPTTFYAKDIQGVYLNNWLYNQYEDANGTIE
jgi:hypothetical protein